MATGVHQRHGLKCNGKGRCDCPWQASVYSKADRKKVRQNFPTRAAAKAWRDDKLGATRRGELRVPTATTVRVAAEAFMEGAKAKTIPTASGDEYKPATLRGYRVSLNKRILPALGNKRLSEVRRADVQELADRLTAEGSEREHRTEHARPAAGDLSPRDPTRRRRDGQPDAGTGLRRPDGKRDRIASPAEAAVLIAAVDVDERALWATAFYAGLRRGELRALRWKHIDLEARVIHVSRGWDALEGEQDTKSAAGKRKVPILDPLTAALIAHKARTGRAGDALVFGRTATDPFNPETVRRNVLAAWGWKEVPNPDYPDAGTKMIHVKAREDALEPLTLHEARHTCASLLIAAGVNPKALSVIMGHSTIAMTFDTYGHLMPGGLDEARAATDAYLARLADGPALKLVA